jgi:hypothetical protein
MYVVEHPLSPDGLSRVSRPTLSAFVNVGTGPIYGVWQQDGTLDGDWVVVSGTELYRVTPAGVDTLLGEIPGAELCQFAGNRDRVLIVRDGIAYRTDGATVDEIVMPDDRLVGSVACIDSSFILSELDAQRFYWILPGDDDPDALAFASAERKPDKIVSVNVISDEIWFVGSMGPEVWTPTGDLDDPYQRVSGRVYGDGCVSRDSVAASVYEGYPCLLWATDTGSVVMAQGSLRKVSDPSVEELLKTATNLRAWTFRRSRSDFYVLTADQFTVVLDIAKMQWSRWDSWNEVNWRAHLGAQSGTTLVAGDLTTNILWYLVEGVDDDGAPVIREVSGFVGNNAKPSPCSSLSARVNAGWTDSYTVEPILELRWSDDMGATFSNYVEIPLGLAGEYNKDITIRSLGLIRRPGRIFEFRMSDPVRFRLDYATINEA